MAARCASCETGIIWTVTVNGRRMPVDEEPDEKGLFTLDEGQNPPLAEHIAGRKLEDGVDRFTSHFATCPNSEKHRSRR